MAMISTDLTKLGGLIDLKNILSKTKPNQNLFCNGTYLFLLNVIEKLSRPYCTSTLRCMPKKLKLLFILFTESGNINTRCCVNANFFLKRTLNVNLFCCLFGSWKLPVLFFSTVQGFDFLLENKIISS